MRNWRIVVIVAGLVALVGVLAGSGAASDPPGVVVMSGLDNPRGLAFGPEGGLYVAEAGRGGPGPPCEMIRGQLQCVGATGAVSRLWHGVQERIATGLPSYAPEDGAGATGPHDISLHGRGGAYVTIGLGANPAIRAEFGQGFGRLVRLKPNGTWLADDDISSYEAEHNPDQSPVPDSNPYGVLAEPGGRVVTDAGGNDLLRVRSNGDISTLAVFPSRPAGTGNRLGADLGRGWARRRLTTSASSPGLRSSRTSRASIASSPGRSPSPTGRPSASSSTSRGARTATCTSSSTEARTAWPAPASSSGWSRTGRRRSSSTTSKPPHRCSSARMRSTSRTAARAPGRERFCASTFRFRLRRRRLPHHLRLLRLRLRLLLHRLHRLHRLRLLRHRHRLHRLPHLQHRLPVRPVSCRGSSE